MCITDSYKSHYGLGTELYLQAYGKNAALAIDKSIEKLDFIDDKMSAFKSSSDIGKINKNAGLNYVPVSVETFKLLKESIKYSKLLKGSFDVTVRPLVQLWNYHGKEGVLPSYKDIKLKSKLVNYKNILFNENDYSIKLKKKNQQLDLGGIAKGYAADEVKKIFNQNHIYSGLINLGGNIFALGTKPDGSPWRVGVQNPLSHRGDYIGILNVTNKSIVTSGNYERYYSINNTKYHHIIDIKTGYPSNSEIISATIISNKSTDGDGLSTGIYILGVEKSLKLIESLEGIDVILITSDKRIYTSSTIRDSFVLTNTDFKIVN